MRQLVRDILYQFIHFRKIFEFYIYIYINIIMVIFGINKIGVEPLKNDCTNCSKYAKEKQIKKCI